MFYMFSSNNVSKQLINANQQNVEVYSLPKNTGYAIQVKNSIQEIKETWDSVAPKDNLFLQSTYLQTLENYPPEKMSFRYIVFYKDNLPIGIAYNQIFKLNVEDSLQQNNEEENTNKSNCLIRAFSNAVKKWFIKRAEFNLLICGNLLLTGEYGFHFNIPISEQQTASLIQDSLDALQNILDKEQTKVSVHLLKDYKIEDCQPLKEQLQKETYHPFLMQPSMYMDMRPHWDNFDSYLGDMSSKYRVRAKRARKKGKAIIKKELSLAEIELHEDRIYELYKMIADGAGFNAFLLHKQYFTALKRDLGDQYKLTAYFIDDQLIAFYTAIFNYQEMDAHFLGVDGAYNREHQVYLNILYDLVNRAIDGQVERIDFARTALEIKSSVGAVSQDMLCFFKHRSTLSSKILQFVFDSLNPKEEWQPRSPFKSDVVSVG
ncbi:MULTISPECIES: GNAT family N-acetyltransferase [unclassified Aureispira]|uniref:GNAT family N-acetyltransferase n=1 Tax=unclassified Aureispira TaxID=2649989 RepID=UPI0009DE4075|nr:MULTISPECIES: GNAT family N-acetyltransferase [unclassified Aureispira]WMX15034.1 GNAT family N-acetyltransferase [Aureispira sp. CCB-E]